MACSGRTIERHRPERHFVALPAGAELRLRVASWRRLARLVLAWIDRRRQRDALAELDAHLLNDIGLTRAEARAEAEKPFWRK